MHIRQVQSFSLKREREEQCSVSYTTLPLAYPGTMESRKNVQNSSSSVSCIFPTSQRLSGWESKWLLSSSQEALAFPGPRFLS